MFIKINDILIINTEEISYVYKSDLSTDQPYSIHIRDSASGFSISTDCFKKIKKAIFAKPRTKNQ